MFEILDARVAADAGASADRGNAPDELHCVGLEPQIRDGLELLISDTGD